MSVSVYPKDAASGVYDFSMDWHGLHLVSHANAFEKIPGE
jgi:hypothetical protein